MATKATSKENDNETGGDDMDSMGWMWDDLPDGRYAAGASPRCMQVELHDVCASLQWCPSQEDAIV